MALILDTGPLYASLDRSDDGRIRDVCDTYADSDIGFVDAAVDATWIIYASYPIWHDLA